MDRLSRHGPICRGRIQAVTRVARSLPSSVPHRAGLRSAVRRLKVSLARVPFLAITDTAATSHVRAFVQTPGFTSLR